MKKLALVLFLAAFVVPAPAEEPEEDEGLPALASE